MGTDPVNKNKIEDNFPWQPYELNKPAPVQI
jgi:hypothetical protein